MGTGTESDGTALVAKCGARRNVTGIPSPLGFTNLVEGSADEVYLDRVWDLDGKVLKATWGEHPPDANVINPGAERAGEKFVAGTRGNGYEDPYRLLGSFLSRYRGPLGKPTYDWQFETEPDVKFFERDEPRLFWSTAPSDMAVKSYNQALLLNVDPHSGNVTKSVWKAGDSSSWMMSRALEVGSMKWVFDPATIPANGEVQVQFNFNPSADRGEERSTRAWPTPSGYKVNPLPQMRL